MNPKLDLISHETAYQSGDLIVRNKEGTREVVLSADKKTWLPLMDGRYDLREFFWALWQQNRKIGFADVLGTLQILDLAGFFKQPVNFSDVEEGPQDESTALDEKVWGIDDVIEFLHERPFFLDWPKAELKALLSQSQFHRLRQGTFLFKEGDAAEDLYVLLSGELGVYRNEAGLRRRICLLGPGALFGESALQEGAKRGADIFCKTNAWVLNIPKSLFVGKDSALLKPRFFLNQFASSSSLFRSLAPEALSAFLNQGKLLKSSSGERIFAKGDPATSFFLIFRGQVQVRHEDYQAARPSISLGQGDCFGEIALFEQIPRTASVWSAEDCLLLEIAAHDFWAILCQNPALGFYLEDLAKRRMSGERLTLT